MMTIQEALIEASSLLQEAGAADGRHEAELLLLDLLGWDRTRLLLDGRDKAFPADLDAAWRERLRRRCAGEPVQYIIGEQEFYGLPFEVNPAVLIPRPETELLVEAIVKHARQLWRADGEAVADTAGKADGTGTDRGGTSGTAVGTGGESTAVGGDSGGGRLLVDIGTGSGAIAVTAASQLPLWRVTACDLSADALAVAERNAMRNEVKDRMAFCQGDLLAPLLASGVTIDVLVSNPPYIASGDMPGLQREVRDYEPVLALDGGEDGLDLYRKLVQQIGELPAAPRLVGFEVGMGQARDVASMLEQTGLWQHYEIVEDYAGIERHVLAWRE